MLNKKIMVIALDLILTIGTIACVVHAQENGEVNMEGFPAVMASAVPVPTPGISPLDIRISADNEDNKYMALNSVLTLSAEGIPEGMEAACRWDERRNSGEWAEIGSTGQSAKVTLNRAGKMESEYRCQVISQDGSVLGESNALKISKIVYKEKLNVKLGGSFKIEDIFGGASVKGVKCVVVDGKKEYSKCINESKKKGKKIYTVKKYDKKIPLQFEYGNDGDGFNSYICVKEPAIKDFAKDIKIGLSKNRTKLTAKFKNIAGISIIQFTPKGLKTDTIKKKEGKGDCTVVYRYKAKFKMKKFKVRYGYKPLGSKKVKYTKPVNVSI